MSTKATPGHTDNTAQVLLFDNTRIEQGPIARIKLPMRQRSGVHGNWVQADDMVC